MIEATIRGLEHHGPQMMSDPSCVRLWGYRAQTKSAIEVLSAQDPEVPCSDSKEPGFRLLYMPALRGHGLFWVQIAASELDGAGCGYLNLLYR